MQTLEPDRDQIEIFVDALFRYAGNKGYVSVRSFFDDNKKVFRISTAKLTGGLRPLIDLAEDDARRAANDPKPVVFCPPVAIFDGESEGQGKRRQWRAREQDLRAGLALSVECDERPDKARGALEELLGAATLIVKSGGVWIDADDGPKDKLHLHWRLARPATGEALAKLKQARQLAAAIVGADTSNVPMVHPLRWPGSWHRKSAPRLCDIFAASPDAEIDLDEAFEKLAAAAPQIAKLNGPANSSEAKPEDWGEFAANIIAGTKLHESITRLAAKYVRSGTPTGAAINQVRALMNVSKARTERPQDWQVRLDYIPRAFDTADDKFRTQVNASEAASEAPRSDGPRASEPKPRANAGAGGQPIRYGRVDVYNAGHLDIASIPPRGWLLGVTFCRKFISGLIAEGALGKTAIRYAQFLAAATGRELTGERVHVRSRVLIACLEDDLDEVRRRIGAAMLRHGVKQEELDGWLFYCTPRGLKLLKTDPRLGLVVGELYAELKHIIERLGIDIVGIDPFIKAHGVGENDNTAIDQVCIMLADLADEANCAIDLVSHARKGLGMPGDAERERGASAKKDAGRLMRTVTGMTPEEAALFNVAEQERPSLIRVDDAKINLAPRSAEAAWFKLIGVPLGNTFDPLYPNGDKVQTVERWRSPDLFASLDTRTANAILNKIEAGPYEGGRYSPAPNAKERAAGPVIQEFCSTFSEKQARHVLNTWIKNGVLVVRDHEDPKHRKVRPGLFVEKRPGDTWNS